MKIEAENLSWAAGPAIIVDGIDVPAMPGRILGLLGPNGSGKSTLLGMLARTIQPRTGVVKLDDRPYSDWAPRDIARVLSVVQQKATTDQDVTVRDVIDLGRIPHRRRWAGPSPRDREVVEAAARRTGIEHLLNRDWHTLSGGEQQRAHLARAFAQEGQVMLLDEPTNHLDIRHQHALLRMVRGLGRTVIAAIHDLDLAATYFDHIVVLNDGGVAADGKPSEVLTPELVGDVFGMAASMVTDPATGEPRLLLSYP